MIMKQMKMNVQVDLVKIMGHALTRSTDFNVGVCLGLLELNVKLVICFYSLTELKKPNNTKSTDICKKYIL